MKTLFSVVCGILACTTLAFADSDGDRPVLVRVPVMKYYIPTGFDSNDNALLMLEGRFSNTCYRVGPQDVEVNEEAQKITITQGAYFYQGPCLMMIVQYNQTVSLGILKAGNYDVIDGASKQLLGVLPISKATNPGPDDHVYAMVKDAYTSHVEDNQWVVVLKLHMPGNCWQIDEKKVAVESENVVTVQPILKRRSGDQCDETGFPYTTTVKLPKLAKGRYMLHVRSLEGQAVTKLFDIE